MSPFLFPEASTGKEGGNTLTSFRRSGFRSVYIIVLSYLSDFGLFTGGGKYFPSLITKWLTNALRRGIRAGYDEVVRHDEIPSTRSVQIVKFLIEILLIKNFQPWENARKKNFSCRCY